MLRKTPLRRRRSTPRRVGPPAPRIKPERQEDPEHLDRLRHFGCWCCRVDGDGWRPAEPHHPRTGGKDGAGTGQKAPDRDAIPLCRRHHNEQHPDTLSIHRNPIQFRARYGSEAEIRDQVLNLLYPEGTPMTCLPLWMIEVQAEMTRARSLHPSPNLLVTAFTEEAGEAVKAVLDHMAGKGPLSDVRKELIQAAAMVGRLLEEGDPIHRLPPTA